MKSWTIAKRIIANNALLLTVIVLVAAIAEFSLNSIQKSAADRIRDDALPGVTSMADLVQLTLRSQIRVLTATAHSDPEQRKKGLELVRQNIADAGKALDAYRDAAITDEDKQNFAKLEQLRSAYGATRAKLIEMVEQNAPGDKIDAFVIGQLEAPYQAYRDQMLMMLDWNKKRAEAATADIVAESGRAFRNSLIVSVVGFTLALVVSFVLVRGINRVLNQVSKAMEDASGQVAAAARQVSGSSQILAEGSSEQAASLEETSSSLEEMASMTKRNAEGAGNAKNLSAETRVAAEKGNNDVVDLRRAMDAVKTSSSDIAKIIKTIDEIAFQTNILALNAAVEAARAGEAGAGFAVVADEVRSLAQRAAAAAKETAGKIEVAIRTGEDGANISTKVAASLEEIVGKARQVDSLVAEIATASHEQSEGITQINSAMSQMDKITQSNASSAEESAAAAEELNAQAQSLAESVATLVQLVSGARVSTSADQASSAKTASVVKSGAVKTPVIRTQAHAAPAGDLHFAES